ncbi:MAG: DegV family protein [Merdibacter sp.]
MHLKRGGRLTPLAATLAACWRSADPAAECGNRRQGRCMDKVRTMSKALARMVEVAREDGFVPGEYELRLLDSEGGDSVEQLRRLLEETFAGCTIERSTICPVIAAHTGLGVVAIQYQKKVEGIA